jgi:hypothetical protein
VYDVRDGGVMRSASADALQHVLWFIDEEEPRAWTPGDGSLMDQLFQRAEAHAGPDIGDVRVLNLWGDAEGTEAAQDQLVMVPEPAAIISGRTASIQLTTPPTLVAKVQR